MTQSSVNALRPGSRRRDWEICKPEALAGQEHHQGTMPGIGINLSGCMQSKGHSYVEDSGPRHPNPDDAKPHEGSPLPELPRSRLAGSD